MSTRVIFAGGGTAGHVEPALAVARAWKSAHADSDISFLGTPEGLEARLIPEAGFTLEFITKVKIARTISPSLLTVPFTLVRTVLQCVSALRRADLLVGFGGYVSGPAYLAALITRTPIVIHEANAIPGLANKLGALFTPFTAVAHAVDSGKLSDAFLAGLPLRQDVALAFESASKDWKSARRNAKVDLGFDSDKPLVFIFGGSQGSLAINDVIAASRTHLTSHSIQVLHGVGARNPAPDSSDGYKALSYITDMATAYLAADVIIARSGAVTCAEVNTLGRYAIFIPLPIGNGEQLLNAADLVSQSRATIVEQRHFTPEWLTSNISEIIAESARAPIAGSRTDIDAATKIVALMDEALSNGRR